MMMVESMAKSERTSGLDASTDKQRCVMTLETLYDKYYGRIYAFCVRRLFCRTVAEDVTSQIFLSAARQFDGFNGDTEQAFSGWLYAIAVNQCNCYIRKHLRRQKLFEKFQRQHPHHQENARSTLDWTAVYGAIAQLKQIEQTVITLRFFENMEFEQISAISNKRQSSVRVILHRGLKKLRKLLNSAECGFEDRGIGHE